MTASWLSKFSLAFALTSSTLGASETKNGRPDVYTTTVIKSKSDVTFESAKKALEALNVVLTKTKGFEKRNLFYDKDQKLWIDQIKWKHLEVAKSGIKAIENDPVFLDVQKITDGKPTAVYQAERVLELNAK